MKLLITGANGYLGARLYTDLKDSFEVVGTYNKNRLFPELIHLDITDREEALKVIKEQKPDIIIHAASKPTDNWCAEHPEEARKANVGGTKNIADAANEVDAKVIYISSTVVMHCKTFYAQTKKAAEEETKQTRNGFLIIHPSLIIGYSPNTESERTFNVLLKSLGTKQTEQDNTWHFRPTYIGHITEVIKETIKRNIWGETIPVIVPERITRFILARDVLGPFGVKVSEKNSTEIPPELNVTQDKLKELRLPQYSYSQVIEKIVQEIKLNIIK